MEQLSRVSGTVSRKLKHDKAYRKQRKSLAPGECQFCGFATNKSSVVEERDNFWIVHNIFPYHVWDGAKIDDHLMIVPKRHIDSIGHFNPKERAEYMNLLAEYESTGYSVYARAPQSIIKSIAHQHTHLIKVGKHIKAQVFVHKPRIRLTVR